MSNQPDWWRCAITCADAQSEKEINHAFDQWFDLVNEARKSGDLAPVNALLSLVSTEYARLVSTDMLLAFVRLTFSIRHGLSHYDAAYACVRAQLEHRDEDVDALCVGLSPTKGKPEFEVGQRVKRANEEGRVQQVSYAKDVFQYVVKWDNGPTTPHVEGELASAQLPPHYP